MKVLKFGGTSLGTLQNFRRVMSLVSGRERKIVVLSAFSGTTDKLLNISKFLSEGEIHNANRELKLLKDYYQGYIPQLFTGKEFRHRGNEIVNDYLENIYQRFNRPFDLETECEIAGFGEFISTRLFHLAMHEAGIHTVWLNALEFMKLTPDQLPDNSFIEARLSNLLSTHHSERIYITQGFVCRDYQGRATHLERGGSDYTATIIGAAVRASKIEIWSDVDGIQHMDPRIIENTHTIPSISYEEATSLSYFGAKVLHPLCVLPAKREGIPILLKNTLNPTAPGTLITHDRREGIKATATKDHMQVITVRAWDDQPPAAFYRKLHKTLSELSLSIDILSFFDRSATLVVSGDNEEIQKCLRDVGEVMVRPDQSIICIAGFQSSNRQDISKVLLLMPDITITCSSLDEAGNCFLLVINTNDRNEVLHILNRTLFRPMKTAA